MNVKLGHIRQGTSAYRRANLALFLAGFVAFSTLYDFQPLLPLLTREFKVTPAEGSLALSIATFALAWTLPLSGTLSDALGRRVMMGTAVIATSLLALATAFSGSLPTLLALRLVQGIMVAGIPAVAMAYLSEEMEAGALGAAMGLYIAGNAMGGMSGRIISASLTDLLPWHATIGIIGGLSLILGVAFLILLPPSRQFHRRPFRPGPLTVSLLGHLRDPGLLCLFTIAFSCMGAFITLYNYVIFRLSGPPYSLSQSQVAGIFLAYAFGAFGSGAIGGFVNRLGRDRTLFAALGVMAVGVLLTLLHPLPALLVGIVLSTIGFFGAHAIASTWVGARAKTARAQASSLYLFSYYLGSSIAGTGGGFFWSAWGWFGVVSLILGLIGIAALAARRLTVLSAASEKISAGQFNKCAAGALREKICSRDA